MTEKKIPTYRDDPKAYVDYLRKIGWSQDEIDERINSTDRTFTPVLIRMGDKTIMGEYEPGVF